MIRKLNSLRIENKKGYYYTIDALLALIVIFSVLLVIKPINKQKALEMSLQDDAIVVLSALKIREIDNSYVSQLITEGKITNLNQSVLEQIAEFYVRGMPEAETLSENIFSSLSTKESIGLWLNDNPVGSVNLTPIESASEIWTSRQILSGIERQEPGQNKSVRGYTAKAFLTRASRSKYFYFGGYFGDGNISINASYEGDIKDVDLEISINKEFDVYINSQYSGHYDKSPSEFVPKIYDISAYKDYFHSGSNIIRFIGSNLYISGGFMKIVYNSSSPEYDSKDYKFPGIEGAINLYDSFYIPSNLSSMEILLHYLSNYTLSLNIGNVTIFNESSSAEQRKTISDSELKSKLNYNELQGKTIPLRLGLIQIGIGGSGEANADVVLITDLSGSMRWRLNADIDGVVRDCNDPDLYNHTTQRLALAKCLDKQVIDIILNASGNRVALSGFYSDMNPPYKGRVFQEDLTNNANYLKTKINDYTYTKETCICCAINDAYKILSEQSNSTRQKFVIVMSDGIPTHQCGSLGADKCIGDRTGLPSREGLWLGGHCSGGGEDCDTVDCDCASQNANWSSCRLYNELDTIVYSIGFGPVAACQTANNTLNDIAKCGGGRYYASDNATLLQDFYSSIAEEILELSYIGQISRIIGSFKSTKLYPDSYIKFGYNQSEIPYGLIITSETPEFGNEITEGSFNISQDATPLEAIAVSYSGPRWTDKVTLFNETLQDNIFNLSFYGSNYLALGDPYRTYIPVEKIKKGENKVRITTGVSPLNSSGGSLSDKVIYTILKPSSSYSTIKYSASGCIWDIEFYDSSNITIKVPLNYSGSQQCYYAPGEPPGEVENDAINNAVYNLLKSLDFNSDSRIDSKFSEQDFQISATEISGVPFIYSSEVQIRVWR